MSDRGWFADWDNEATNGYGWQPCLETGAGLIPSFEVWFKTRAECEQWIAENVIGVEWLPGEPTAIPAARVAPSRVPGEDPRCTSHSEDGRRCHGDARHSGTHWAGASRVWSDTETLLRPRVPSTSEGEGT